MGLYISKAKTYKGKETLDSYIRSAARRKASHVFFSFKDNIYLYFNHSASKICELGSASNQYAAAVCQYASDNKIDSFEILLTSEQETNQASLEYFLDYLYYFASEAENSIGILFRSKDFIEENETLLYLCGVIFFSKHLTNFSPTKSDYSYFENIVYSAGTPKLAREINPSSESGIRIKKNKKPQGAYRVSSKPDIHLEESFHDKFMRFYIESEMDAPEVYNNGCISRQVFSKILSNPDFIPKKTTIFCLILGLRLNVSQARELLDSAGYSLSKSLPVDSLIERAIRIGEYNIDIINLTLNEMNCPLLGWRPREEETIKKLYPNFATNN